MDKLNRKIEVLGRIYELFDETMAQFDVCCKIKCAACCTCNVAVTGLEAQLLCSRLDDQAIAKLLDRLSAVADHRRYQPELTTNRFARYCVEGRQVPEEENDPAWGRCPLLLEDLCSVYEGRPFGCRALMSQTDCLKSGAAQVPPIALTYQNIFMQAVEHLDAGGIYGNLIDVVPEIARIREQAGKEATGRFARNETIPVLMVPPEHRGEVAKVVEALSALIK